ncbi:hypothetical protein SAMN05216330_110123 [Bradyrhizobium sp. Ghvi]|uniref:hypothetical protein n=1 Tax=Bradyrhizobium sp. Ghvi TaxID=1855319 RepID=UPI0008F0DC04|nr:hypothetical protein [Bradyrhizobium sp. Ghvi]SFP78936.1 hypothetical protein SAMN05216330_110123 [Bradyrhizobium sp. Ghvi]
MGTAADIILVRHTNAPRATVIVIDLVNDEKARAVALEIAARTGRSVTVYDDQGDTLFEIAAPLRN